MQLVTIEIQMQPNPRDLFVLDTRWVTWTVLRLAKLSAVKYVKLSGHAEPLL